MRALTRLGPLLFALYPLAIFVGLHYLDPRSLGLLVVLALALRYRRHVGNLLGRATLSHGLALAIPLGLGLAVLATNSERLLLFYPAAVSASMLVVFAATLVHPPTMVERFARLHEPDLSPARVRYTRRVTQAWCVFFAANGLAAACTATIASREAWVLYNGFIAYLLMGALFAGERLVRRRWLPA